jgi:general secretion pathway protein J
MNSNLQNESDQHGFTLLEVIIALAILVFIAFSIFQATTQTYKLRDSLVREGNFYNSIRLATTVMSRDITLIYSPIATLTNYKRPDINTPIDPQKEQALMVDDLGQVFKFWGRAIDQTGVRPSRFVGTENKLSFITLSHIRIYKDSPESEFAKVTYEIKPEQSTPDNPNPEGSVLVKTESPNAFAVDESKDQFLRSFEVLHGVKTLSYTYYLRDGNTWKTFKNWDSDKEETKNQLPSFIELKLDVVGPKNLLFEGRYKFRPEIPIDGLSPST